MIAAGRFREDLSYRLNVITITPLRERPEDVPDLARHFLTKYSRKMLKPVRAFNLAALQALALYDWPGNVRELENVVEHAVILCDGESIGRKDLAVPDAGPAAASPVAEKPGIGSLERDHILRVLKETGGNQSRASQLLGIDRKTLYLKLRKYGLPEVPA